MIKVYEFSTALLQCHRDHIPNIFVETMIHYIFLGFTEGSKEQDLVETEIFCNIINDPFDPLRAVLLVYCMRCLILSYVKQGFNQ